MMELKQLGNKVPLPESPDEAILEKIPFEAKGNVVVRFSTVEFSSLCRVTEQPDFATIIIDYIPDKYLVESKSIKLFFGSFRNHKAFHEECVKYIGNRLYAEILPKWIRVVGIFESRGGVPIDVYYILGEIPKGKHYYVPDVNMPYKGRH